VLYQYDLDEDAERLPNTLPVVCIHAEDDTSAPVNGVKRLASKYSNWRLFLLNGTGHQPWLRAPKACVAIILGTSLMTPSDFVAEM
jgi:pimeloyl-ACP methyl ester carboxylesterase